MIKIKQAIIVEGKYDKIKLSSIIDGIIIQTDGYGIFKDKEKLDLIRFYANTVGIIILTDSDSAGFKIRNYIKSCINDTSKIINVYTPDIFGKEKRKIKPSAEGKLGVEGLDVNIILDAFKKANIDGTITDKISPKITQSDLYKLGLIGNTNSKQLRAELLKYLKLPERLTTKGLLEVLNTLYSIEDLKDILNLIKK